jgi:Alpha-mannosidase
MEKNSMAETIRNNLKGREIHIIPYAHPDYAWTHYRQWHVERYILIINEVLDIMKENPDYTWMTDNINHILEPFFKYCPARIDEFRQRVMEGRIELTNGIISLVRSTQAGDEAFIRNIVLGKNYCAGMFPGVDIDVYNNVDVAVGHSQLPQVLKLAGYKYFWCWRPQGAMDYKGIPGQFWWRGLDGTGLLCARGAYNGLCGLEYMNGDFDNDWDNIVEQFYAKDIEEILKRANVTDLWITNGMDDTRPLRDYTDEPCNLSEFIKNWNEKEKCRLYFSTTRNYFNRIAKENLPVVEGILDACDVGYNTPQKGARGLWRIRKEVDRLLVKAETLCAMASIAGFDYPEDKINDIWMKLLNVSGHAQEALLDTDYEYIYSIAQNAGFEAEELIRQARFNLTMKVVRFPHNNDNIKKQFVLFNTLNWEREEIVPLHIAQPTGGRQFKLVDQCGNELMYQVNGIYKGDVQYKDTWFDEIDILAKVRIPALGYVSLDFVEKESGIAKENFNIDEDDIDLKLVGSYCQTIDTGAFKVAIREGRIVGISDSDGKSVYDLKDNVTPINEIRFTRVSHHPKTAWLSFSHYQAVNRFQPDSWKWLEYGPLRWKVLVDGNVGPHRVRQEIILYKDKKYIDFNVDIDCVAGQTGFFSAAFPIDKGSRMMADIPFGVEERNISVEPYGKVSDNIVDNIERFSKGIFYARSWIDYNYGGIGNSFISENCGNYYLLDDDSNVSVILTKAIDYEKSTDWMKHSHQWINCEGRSSFKYTLYMHEREEDLYKIAKLAREKAIKIDAEAKLGSLEKAVIPISLSMLDIQGDSIIISVFYKCEGRYILRFYESSGKISNVKIKSYRKLKNVSPVDFFGNMISREAITVSDDGLNLETVVRPWEIVNLAIDFI